MLCSYQFARAIDGVFEASDEVIGAVDQEVIEKVRCVMDAMRAAGRALDVAEGRRLLELPAVVNPMEDPEAGARMLLDEARRQVEQPIMEAVAGRNSGWFDAKPRDRHRAFPKSSRERTSAAST